MIYGTIQIWYNKVFVLVYKDYITKSNWFKLKQEILFDCIFIKFLIIIRINFYEIIVTVI